MLWAGPVGEEQGVVWLQIRQFEQFCLICTDMQPGSVNTKPQSQIKDLVFMSLKERMFLTSYNASSGVHTVCTR